MLRRISIILCGVAIVCAAYLAGTHHTTVAHAQTDMHGTVPKSYGKLVTAIADSIGTGLIFEDAQGVIRFVSINGMKEGELARYDNTPTRGGIPKSYGRLVTAVVHGNNTGLIFEDAQGTIRFVTMAGVSEAELNRN